MLLLSFDPGTNTGWALFNTDDPEKLLQSFGTCRNKIALYAFLGEVPPVTDLTVVYEDYIIKQEKSRGGFDHNNDKGETLRIIGAIEHWAWERKYPVGKPQQASMKPGAYGQVGLTYKKGQRDRHHMDAVVHGFDYLLKNKLAPANRILLSMKGKPNG